MKIVLASFLNYVYNNLITHIPWHGFRLFFLRLFNKKIDSSAKILMHVRILCFWDVVIGKNVVINQYCLLDCRKYPVIIEHNTDIGPYTRIWTLGHDPDDNEHGVIGGEVRIGHHVWIASGVTILPNITLGDGCVIAAAAVVHKSVEPKKIVAGNPAREVRKRKNSLNYQLAFTPIFE